MRISLEVVKEIFGHASSFDLQFLLPVSRFCSQLVEHSIRVVEGNVNNTGFLDWLCSPDWSCDRISHAPVSPKLQPIHRLQKNAGVKKLVLGGWTNFLNASHERTFSALSCEVWQRLESAPIFAGDMCGALTLQICFSVPLHPGSTNCLSRVPGRLDFLHFVERVKRPIFLYNEYIYLLSAAFRHVDGTNCEVLGSMTKDNVTKALEEDLGLPSDSHNRWFELESDLSDLVLFPINLSAQSLVHWQVQTSLCNQPFDDIEKCLRDHRNLWQFTDTYGTEGQQLAPSDACESVTEDLRNPSNTHLNRTSCPYSFVVSLFDDQAIRTGSADCFQYDLEYDKLIIDFVLDTPEQQVGSLPTFPVARSVRFCEIFGTVRPTHNSAEWIAALPEGVRKLTLPYRMMPERTTASKSIEVLELNHVTDICPWRGDVPWDAETWSSLKRVIIDASNASVGPLAFCELLKLHSWPIEHVLKFSFQQTYYENFFGWKIPGEEIRTILDEHPECKWLFICKEASYWEGKIPRAFYEVFLTLRSLCPNFSMDLSVSTWKFDGVHMLLGANVEAPKAEWKIIDLPPDAIYDVNRRFCELKRQMHMDEDIFGHWFYMTMPQVIKSLLRDPLPLCHE